MVREKRKYVVGAVDNDTGYIYGSVGLQHILATTFDNAERRADEIWHKEKPAKNVVYELVPVDKDGRRLT